MRRIEELADVPKGKLDIFVKGLELDGGLVSIVPQADGRFTIRAVFLEEDAAGPTKGGSGEGTAVPATEGGAQWFEVAKQELASGVKEIRGESAHHPRIVEYHKTTSGAAEDDETPWCSSFVNFCIQQAGIEGTNSARARSWESWGRALSQPVTGCIAVLTRPGGGHVAFYVGQDNDQLLLLGGNQGDRVSIARFPKSRLLGFRWPEPMA